MAIKFDANKEVTNKLKFKPDINLGNLCLGKIVSVEVVKTEVAKIDEKGKERAWEYAGLELPVPSLSITFKQVHTADSKDKADRFYTFRENIIGSTKTNGEPIEGDILESLYQSMWDRIKHIHDAFANTPNYKAFTSLPEINERGKAIDRLKQFTAFFETIAEGFTKGKNDKPVYELTDGTSIKVWMKLIAEYKEGKYLTFPKFVGEGFIERYIDGVPPTIEIKGSESVILKSKSVKAGVPGGADSSEDLPEHIRAMMENK